MFHAQFMPVKRFYRFMNQRAPKETLQPQLQYPFRREIPGIRHGYWEHDHGHLHYIDVGEGPLILLSHGWNNSWFGSVSMIRRLAPHARVVAIDVPGFGESTVLPTTPGYSYPLLAELYAGLVNNLDQPVEMLVMVSMSSPIAFEYAKLTNYSGKFVWIATPIQSEKERFKHQRVVNVVHDRPWVQRHTSRMITSPWFRHRSARHFSTHVYDAMVVESLVQYYQESELDFHDRALFAMPKILAEYHLEQHLAEFKKSALILWGQYDRMVNWQSARPLLRSNRWLRKKVLPRAGHSVNRERPEQCAEAILQELT